MLQILTLPSAENLYSDSAFIENEWHNSHPFHENHNFFRIYWKSEKIMWFKNNKFFQFWNFSELFAQIYDQRTELRHLLCYSKLGLLLGPIFRKLFKDAYILRSLGVGAGAATGAHFLTLFVVILRFFSSFKQNVPHFDNSDQRLNSFRCFCCSFVSCFGTQISLQTIKLTNSSAHLLSL